MSNDSSKKMAWACVIGVLLIIGMIGNSTSKECKMDGCSRTTVENSQYCSIHDPFYEGARTYERNNSGNSYSVSASKTNSSSSSSSYKSSSSSSSSSGYKSNSSSKSSYSSKTSMPDCDDYEDYDDFMDDWDGYMPDGSDAEDYWENW